MRTRCALLAVLLSAAAAPAQERRAPPIPPDRRQVLEENLARAEAEYAKRPDDVEAVIWLGRRTAYLNRFREAIDIFTRGIERHPGDIRLYRHRGHRYITVREFDKAIADLDKATRLIAERSIPDAVEPDGDPNPRNVPTSTSHFNIWYHLGLAHYLKGDFESAARAYRRCMEYSAKSDDRLVATTDWLYMTLRRLGRKAEADALLAPITADLDVIENTSYWNRLLMYKGRKTPEELLGPSDDPVDLATYGYGVGNWYLYNGQPERAREVFQRVVAGPQSNAFGFIAAEVDLARMGALPSPAAVAEPGGVVVDEVHAGFGGEQAGLQPGDVLLRWERAANPPANPTPARGEVRSQFDFVEVELEQAPRGELTFEGLRNGEPFSVRMPRQDWVLSVRPHVEDGDALAAYYEARRVIETDEYARGFARWLELARAFRARGQDRLASWLFLKLARFAAVRGGWEMADGAFHDAADAAAGDAAALALIHGFAATSRVERLDWTAAAAAYEKALEIQRARGPGTLHEARILDQLGDVAFKHGDLQTADLHLRRALDIREAAAPRSAAVANSLHNLGLVAAARGDLASGEDYFQRSLALTQELAPGTLGASLTLHNLGTVAEQRGDLSGAERYYEGALAYWRQHLPESVGMASGLVNLANVALKMGRAAAAREIVPGAWELAERILPGGIVSGDAAISLGDVAVVDGDLDAAEAWYGRALQIRQAQLPGSAAEAEAHQRLAALQRRRKRPAEALPLYLRALDVLDGQRRRLGGTDEVKTRFAARYAAYYHETLDVLMELGRPEEAFHVLERYRSRAFLELLAERDLVFTADVPEALDRERRAAGAEHDRVFAALAGATGPASDEARRALDAVRRRQADIEARVRAASPRLAALQHPQPLDLRGTRAALDPGTLLLSYAVGDGQGHVFAVGPGPDDFAAFTLDVTRAKLRGDVGRFRQFLQERSVLGRKPLRALAERLGAVLLAPVADRIARAERVLILADGPLHLVPFAVLADPGAPGTGRSLVEAKPISTAASATVFAGIRGGRAARRPARLVAFGDPDYGSSGPGATSLVRSLRERGLELAPLPGSRVEVEGLKGLYPSDSRVYLGTDASEERARRAGGEPSLLHFACHALADEASPLDSSLVLSLPAAWKPGQPNGLLQAWEILEQVRIDADLVTLSACGTALGQEMSGEGMIGLTRAFQYAGARTVLASLWSVSDESTADLMRRFYRRLRRGEAKDAALRGAQLEMLATPRFSHPALWAAFQLSGDWK